MILAHDVDSVYSPDPAIIQLMANAGLAAMQRIAIPDITTSSEVLSASFLLMDRLLSAVRDVQEPEVRFDNARIITAAIHDLLVIHGKVPS